VHRRTAHEFLRRTGVGRGERLLSLGCGDGAIERQLAPHVGEIVGLDVSGVAVARARAAARGLSNLSFVECDPRGRALDAWGRFDAIAAFAFLHHLDDAGIDALLAQARAALPDGGCFYSVDPSRRRMVRVFAALVRGAYERHHSPDERELDPEGIAAAARRAGFARTELRYTDFFLGPLAWLAPGTPRWTAPVLAALDALALHTPLVRRYASSFSLIARPA
jgi:SAM-dependent methyltransferase